MIVKRARLPLGAVGIQLLAESQCLREGGQIILNIYVLNMEQGPNPPLNPYSRGFLIFAQLTNQRGRQWPSFRPTLDHNNLPSVTP